MTRRYEPHYGDQDVKGTEHLREFGVSRAHGATVPSDAATGYAQGCIFMVTSGSVTVNTVIYVNIGDKTSANFDPLKG